jgi:hypothetical protein
MKRGRSFILGWIGLGLLILGGLGLFVTVGMGKQGTFTLSRGIDISIFLIIGGAILVGVGNLARQ